MAISGFSHGDLAMALGKQAKIISRPVMARLLEHVSHNCALALNRAYQRDPRQLEARHLLQHEEV